MLTIVNERGCPMKYLLLGLSGLMITSLLVGNALASDMSMSVIPANAPNILMQASEIKWKPGPWKIIYIDPADDPRK